jgi:hypothetical protein
MFFVKENDFDEKMEPVKVQNCQDTKKQYIYRKNNFEFSVWLYLPDLVNDDREGQASSPKPGSHQHE